MLWTNYCRKNEIKRHERDKLIKILWRNMMWTKPEYTEMRFGFEVTMYIANR